MLTAFALAGCSKDDGGKGSTITVPNQNQLTQTVFADNTSGKSDVAFTTTAAWTSSIAELGRTMSANATPSKGAADWISIDPASGEKAGSYKINISLTTNLIGVSRTATITINSGGDKITITVTQEATTEDGQTPNPEPSGSGVLTNETTAKTVKLIGIEHTISGPESVHIEFIGEELIVDGKPMQDRFMADFHNPLVNGRLKTGTYIVQPINTTPAPEVQNGDCAWFKSSLGGGYGNGGTVKVDYSDNTYTFTIDIRTEIENQVIKGSFTGAPKYLNEEVKVASISLNESQKELKFGESFSLNATILPENATDTRIKWSSSNTAVATVDQNGYVRAVAAGRATITVTSNEGNKTATCEVTIGAAIPVQSIKVEPTEITILKGDYYEPINVTILPQNATNQGYD